MSTDTAPRSTSAGRPLRPAKQRTGAGPIGWVGPLMALLLTLVGLVLLRDAIFAPAGGSTSGWPAGQPSWLGSATSALDGTAAAGWMVVVGVVLALVGLYLLVVALRRRPRRAIPLAGDSGAYLLVADVARRAGAAASDVDGVLSASASATRHRVTITAETTGGSTGQRISDEVRAAVSESLKALASPPQVRVKTSTSSDDKDLT